MGFQITKGDKTALIFGASGMVGQYCLSYLLDSGIYSKVISIGRKTLDVEHPKLSQKVIDFDQLTAYQELIQGDDLFCCLGTTIKKAGSQKAFIKVDYQYIFEIARMAAANQVHQFLLISAVGADEDSVFFYNQVKGKTERAVKELDFWALHIFQPAILLGERAEFRPLERLAMRLSKGLDYFLGDYLGQYKPVEAETVAKAMLNAAQNLKAGQFLYSSNQLENLAEKQGIIKR